MIIGAVAKPNMGFFLGEQMFQDGPTCSVSRAAVSWLKVNFGEAFWSFCSIHQIFYPYLGRNAFLESVTDQQF